MSLLIGQVWIIYSMYRVGEVHAASGLLIPTLLEEEVQTQDQQVTTRSPRIVTECLLT